MLTSCEDIGMITVLKVATSRLTSADYAVLKATQAQVLARGRSAILVDLSGVRRAARSGLAALVEFQTEAPRGLAIGFFGANKAVQREFDRCALATLLTAFENRQNALDAPQFRARRLAGMKAVILVAGAGSRMRPMSETVPKPMIELLGRPVLDHIMAHLAQFGVRDFLLNPGHNGPQFHAHVHSSALRSVQFLNEGHWSGNQWRATPLGSASTLKQMQTRLSAFDDDFLVVCGDALVDLDVAAMMDHHRASGAEVTIATQTVPADQVHKYGILDVDSRGQVSRFIEKPRPHEAPSSLASTGIYVISPRALARLSPAPNQDIANDLLPAVLAHGGVIQAFSAPFSWVDVGCGRDYYRAVSHGLRGLVPGLDPEGRLLRRQVWGAPGAVLSARAVVVGPCYLGPDAVVEAGAKLEGPTVIGARARVCGRSLIRRSVILPNTRITPGTWVDDMIAGPDWAIDHRFADGSDQPQMPLDGVERCDAPAAIELTLDHAVGGQ